MIRVYVLLVAVALVILGGVFRIFPLITVPLGLGLLLAAYVIQRCFSAPQAYRVQDMELRTAMIGEFSAISGSLIVSDKPALALAQKITGLNGTYKVTISELFTGDFSLISRISAVCSEKLNGTPKYQSIEVTVDTGWLLFIGSAESTLYTPKQLGRLVARELKRLNINQPLCFWLKGCDGRNIGVVVGTGEGDGCYSVKCVAIGGRLAEFSVVFIEEPREC